MMAETTVNVDNNKATSPEEGTSGDDGGNIAFDLDYCKSILGILKLVQLLLGILCMSLSSWWWSGWFVFVAVMSFIVTLLWFLANALSIPKAIDLPVNWKLSELISTAVQALLYFITTVVLFSMVGQYYGPGRAANTAAAVFGVCNIGAYAYDAFLLFKNRDSDDD